MDKPIETWNLPQWAKVKTDVIIDWVERNDEVLTFKKMDWMYWQWFTDDWQMVVFNSRFSKWEWDFYIFYDSKDD